MYYTNFDILAYSYAKLENMRCPNYGVVKHFEMVVLATAVAVLVAHYGFGI